VLRATDLRPKYRNRATGGYASAKEARRAQELKLLERAGKIRRLREQVPFVLIPKQMRDGKVIERACKYVADFVYIDPDVPGCPIVEDVKGMRTKEYVIKRKLLLFTHGIRIKEI
jgi:hypothetical protein